MRASVASSIEKQYLAAYRIWAVELEICNSRAAVVCKLKFSQVERRNIAFRRRRIVIVSQHYGTDLPSRFAWIEFDAGRYLIVGLATRAGVRECCGYPTYFFGAQAWPW